MVTRPLPFILCALSCASAGSLPLLPISFEQRAPQFFSTRSGSLSAIVHPDRVEMNGITLRFLRTNPAARLEGAGHPSPATYIAPGARRSYPQFPKLTVRQLYPGIDLVFHGTGGQLEYDLEIAPHTSPGQVRLSFGGARRLHLDTNGDLIVDTPARTLRQKSPRVLQAGRTVPARYLLLAHNQVGFRLGPYDRRLPLTIDPVLASANYFGGSGSDSAVRVATDAQGNVYVAGRTNSVDFPSANAKAPGPTPPLVALASAGQTVTPLPVGAETSVSALGGSPDGQVLYAATPDGIFYSPDFGATWRKCAALPVLTSTFTISAVQVNDISVDAIDPSRAYVATTRGMFATADNGMSWRAADYGLASNSDGTVYAQSVTVSQVDHTVLYATTGRPNYLYKSTDAAGTWQLLNPFSPGEPAPGLNFSSLIVPALVPGGTDLFTVNANGNLLKSADGGATWQKLGDRKFGARLLRIDPSNASNIFVLDNFGVEISRDGGATFTAVIPPGTRGFDATAFAWNSSASTLYAATPFGLYATRDQGATWQIVPQIFNATVHTLVTFGSRVLAAFDSPQTPFLVKFDPSGSRMLYSAFFSGGLIDTVNGLVVDARGSAYLAGFTTSATPTFTTNLSPPGTPLAPFNSFIAKVSPDGSNLLYADLLSASHGAQIQGLAVDSTGAAYVTGTTSSLDFPTTPGAVQPGFPTAACTRPLENLYLESPNLFTHAFVSKLAPDGSALTYSSFLSGSCGSYGQAIALNSAGEMIVGGLTTAPDFPVSPNAYQPAFPGPVDKTLPQNALSAGFLARLSAAGDKVLAGTFIGGGHSTQVNAIALDAVGNPVVTGATWGIAPGATPGAFQTTLNYQCIEGFGPGPPHAPTNGSDAFVLQLDPALTTPRFLTYLGGACYDSGSSIALDSSANIWVAGTTAGSGFPISAPFQGPGASGGFITELSPDASRLLFSSFADGSALAIAPSGAIYLAGAAYIAPIPKVTGAFQFTTPTTAWLAKVDPAAATPLVIDSVDSLNVLQSQPGLPSVPGGIAPGEYIRIRGRNLGPAQTVEAKLDSSNRLPFSLSGVRVLFDDFPAPLISVQDGAIYCFIPFEVARVTQVTVESNGQRSNTVRIAASPSVPQILTVANADGAPNTADHPAQPGSVITLYMTGLGQTIPGGIDGQINARPLPIPNIPVTAILQGQFVQPEFVAGAAGMIAGITQVNVSIPLAKYPSGILSLVIGSGSAIIHIAP